MSENEKCPYCGSVYCPDKIAGIVTEGKPMLKDNTLIQKWYCFDCDNYFNSIYELKYQKTEKINK